MDLSKALLAIVGVAMLVTPSAGAQHGQAGPFRLCSNRVHSTCVIDGDTFRWQGERIRLLEIDAPETHPSRCAAEAELGQRATLRLQQLLNAGGWTLERGDRDRDQYGRLLRRVAIGKTDAGAILVAEGLARPWDGARHPWC